MQTPKLDEFFDYDYLRTSVKRTSEAMTDVNLQLGAFDRPFSGWLNTDITPHLFVSRVPALPALLARMGLISSHRLSQHRAGVFSQLRYLNVAKPFPFKSDSVQCIYSSQMLEHLEHEVAMRCLKECYRVLRPGGVMRIGVPDLDQLIVQYKAGDPDTWLYEFLAVYSKGDKNRHWWHYNEYSLSQKLQQIGFGECYRCAAGQGRCADVSSIETSPDLDHGPVLIMEAIKPS